MSFINGESKDKVCTRVWTNTGEIESKAVNIILKEHSKPVFCKEPVQFALREAVETELGNLEKMGSFNVLHNQTGLRP